VELVEGGEERTFYHPYMQTWLMFVGEGICFLFYLAIRNKLPASNGSKPKAKIIVCLLPLALDLSSSLLIFIALNYLSGSVYSIISSVQVIFVAIFSRCLLKRILTKEQIVGGVVTAVGAVLAGVGESLAD
jgi:drug/metabolite transporter (DMT)-like permease